LLATQFTEEELELAEELREALTDGDAEEREAALADVLFSALVRVPDGLDRARDAIVWLNQQTPQDWHFHVPEGLLSAATARLEAQGYTVCKDRLPALSTSPQPTLVVEFAKDSDREDSGALITLLREFAGVPESDPLKVHGVPWTLEHASNGSRSRVTLAWPRLSRAVRPTAPMRVTWLRRASRPRVLPVLCVGPDLHLTTLHHVVALAKGCGELCRAELLDSTGTLAEWNTDGPQTGPWSPAYKSPPGVLVDAPIRPDQAPVLWWRATEAAQAREPRDTTALDDALDSEPSGGPGVAEALCAYADELPPIEFGTAPRASFLTPPPDGDHLVIAPRANSICISLPADLPLPIRRDLLLHAVGHILLGHIRPDSQHALWDTAATLRISPETRQLDRAVQETFADWFPHGAAPELDDERKPDVGPEPVTTPEAEPKPEPTSDNRTFLLALRALLAQEPWHIDPFAGMRGASVDPLPHQVRAVYDRMLGHRPLRLLLADDPGAGKTIMAGLLIRERLLRGTLHRCLIVAPGGLVEQWQGELDDRFGLHFDLLTPGSPAALPGSRGLLIARLDQFARSKKLIERFRDGPRWDLVVVDEAHKMAAHPVGKKIGRTTRYRLGEQLEKHTEDLLLMTATPHNGVEGKFQLSLALLDRDRFAGPYHGELPDHDTRDLLLRRVKENLVKFDGTKLFPDRRASTVAFDLHPEEQTLYEGVTDYVRQEMNRIEDADVQQRNQVGFAMQVLQRRLASSPKAIHISLERRRDRLRRELARQKLSGQQTSWDVDLEDVNARELENLEDQIVKSASAARSTSDLDREVRVLDRLERMAKQLLHASVDSKWETLRGMLDLPPVRAADGTRRKLVVFTESRDTLNHLVGKLRNHIGKTEAVTEIHGDVTRDRRTRAVDAFMNDPTVLVLVANDAAGEGVNLQRAHLLVNYDLPWNPNRLEQRFGRIHRIGQTETCVFWNFLARGTREGDVYIRLLEKLECEREALGGRVYDVLGQLFEDRPLEDILREAALAGGDAAPVESRVTNKKLAEILERGEELVTRDDKESLNALETRLDETDPGRFLALDEVVPGALEALSGRVRRSATHLDVQRVPGVVQRRRDAEGNRLERRYNRLPIPLDRDHPLVAATLSAFLEKNLGLLRGRAVMEADVSLTGPTPAFLVEETVEQGGSSRRRKRLLATDGGVIELARHVRSLAPTAATTGLDAAAFTDGLREIEALLAEQAQVETDERRPEVRRRHRETTARLERALEAREADVERLASRRSADSAPARKDVADLKERLRAQRRSLRRALEDPSVEVRVLAEFTLVPRGQEPVKSDAPTPHEVQREALESLSRARANGKRSGMVVLATGLGKTWLSAFDFGAMGGRRALFVAHREEILAQAATAWQLLLPDRTAGFFNARQKDLEADLLFASVQTLSRRQHLLRFPPDSFDYIVVDEFHHAAAASYRRVIGHFAPRFLLGMTATPDRTDGASLLALCDGNELHRASLVEGITRDLLAPFQYFGLKSEIDYERVNWRAGRFDLDELTEASEPWTEQAWTRFLERAGPAPRRTLVFCCTTRHADFVAAFLRGRGVSAVAVHSAPGSADRKKSLRRLRAGEIEAICCVDVFNEGVDLPRVDHVLMLRPTESPIVFLQQLGRGLRRASGKTSLTVVDFIGNHRSFLLKPAVLMQLLGESPSPSASVQRIKNKRLKLPPGCRLEIETEAIDLLEQLARRSRQDVLLYEYQSFWEAHGRRPSAGELFAAGANLGPIDDNHGSWFDFLASRADLDEDERRVLDRQRPWLDGLWGLRKAKRKLLPSSAPLLALQVLLDEGALFDRLHTTELLARVEGLAKADPFLPRATGAESDALALWTSRGPAGVRRFELRAGQVKSLLQPQDEDEDVLTSMTAELVDLLLRRRRHKERLRVLPGTKCWLLKVSHAGGDRPMLWLHRDKNPGLPPEGRVSLEIDGELHEADIVKVALNVVRPRGGGDNVLPNVLRGWFGPLAGGTGTQHYVRLEDLGGGFRLSRDTGVDPLGGMTRPGESELPFFPHQSVACGLDPATDLAKAAPLRVRVQGEFDPGTSFVLRARGDSMDGGPTPIRDGDSVAFRWLGSGERDPETIDGPCLLVGRNGGEPLIAVKTPVRRAEAWWLVSANPNIPDERVRPGMRLQPVARVLGVVDAEIKPRRWHIYDRPAVAALFGDIYNKGRWNVGHVDLDNLGQRTSVLFVSLRKRSDTPDQHRYRDRFLNRTELRWESQARTWPGGKKGRRIVGHADEGRSLHAFVRTQSRDPFVYCGQVRYVRHEGEKPMRCVLELPERLPNKLWRLWGSA